jgi:predicted HicB family RNase H-like nuclease
MNALREYKGYAGTYEIDEELSLLVGRVDGLSDVITFEGRTADELVRAFHGSVDDYLAFCEQRGRAPETPYSGRFVVRVSPELHRSAAAAARAAGVSMNAWVAARLEEAVGDRTATARRPRRAAAASRR